MDIPLSAIGGRSPITDLIPQTECSDRFPKEMVRPHRWPGCGGWNFMFFRGFRFQKVKLGGQLLGGLMNRGDNDLPVDNFEIAATLFGSQNDLLINGVLYHDTFPPQVELSISPGR